MDMEERERICVELLDKFPKNEFVLIGGYASSSFDFPRFSVDLDIVVSEKSLDRFVEILADSGFEPIEGHVPHVEDVYDGHFKRFEHEKVNASVDLLINSVISRQTGYSYSFDYLKRNAEFREVVGFSVRTHVNAPVANREMLIALKTNSMRRSDVRDIVALCNGDVDLPVLYKHLRNCPREKILKHIEEMLGMIQSDKFKDALKGVFMLPDSVYNRITSRAITLFQELRTRMSDS